MKIRNLFILLIIFIQALSLKTWLSCKNFLDYYHFSLTDLTLQVNYALMSDGDESIIVAHLLHNKLVQFVLDIYKRYLHFFDLQMIITLIGFLSLVGLVLGIWYLVNSKKKNIFVIVFALLIFVFPLIEIIFNLPFPFILKIIFITIPMLMVSIYGHYHFIWEKNIRIVILVYLLLITLSLLWLFILPEQAFKYCIKV